MRRHSIVRLAELRSTPLTRAHWRSILLSSVMFIGASLAARTDPGAPRFEDRPKLPPADRNHLGLSSALTFAALAWGLVNFGILLWLPSALPILFRCWSC